MSSEELIYINWREMIKPEKVQLESKKAYGKFVCEPLERGFGITLGNSLRRIILSSLYGAAIVSVKFDDVLHEYSVVPGVLEDVAEIILNLKEVRFKVSDIEPKMLSLRASGKGIVTAADIVCGDGSVEVLACGNDDAITRLEQWLQDGPPMALVDSVERIDMQCEQPAGFTTG